MGLFTNVTFVLVLLAVLVLILSNVELRNCKSRARYSIPLPADFSIIQPETVSMRYPIYIFNASRIKRSDIKYLPSYDEKIYRLHNVPVHLATKIDQPILSMYRMFRKIPKSNLPLNTLYRGLSKGDTLVNNLNPLSGSMKHKYKILIANVDSKYLEAFADDKIYFI